MMAALTVRMCGHEMTPPLDVRRGRWCLGCRCGIQSAVTFGNGCAETRGGQGDKHRRMRRDGLRHPMAPTAHPGGDQLPRVVSAAYKSEHDGHTAARRFLQRANTVCCRPAPSTPTRWIGRAQNPVPATFDHERQTPTTPPG